MPRRLPPLVALRAVEAAARLGSIRRAAVELSISHAVVSRHIRNLEAWMGAKLLVTGPNGAVPTPEGQRFIRKVSTGLDIIAAATEELKPARGGGEIRIWCAAGLATRWFTRRLPELEAVLGSLEIVLVPTERTPDFSRREADVGITWGGTPERDVRMEPLVVPRMFPVASPTFVARRGPFQKPEDLIAQPLLHEESRDQWRNWFAAAGVNDVPNLFGPRLWHADVTIEAAIQGQGIAIANQLLVSDDLAAGRLTEILSTSIRFDPYVMQTPTHRWNDPDIRKLRRWLVDRLSTEETEKPGAF